MAELNIRMRKKTATGTDIHYPLTKSENIIDATHEPTPDTVAIRDSAGRLRVGDPSHEQDAVNKGYFDANVPLGVDVVDEFPSHRRGRLVLLKDNTFWLSCSDFLEPEIKDQESLVNTPYEASFSPDGNYVAVAHQGTPFFALMKRTGDTLAVVSTFNLGGNGRSVKWVDNEYLVVGYFSALRLLKRTGDTVSSVATISPGGAVRSLDVSPDGQHVAVGHANSPRFSVVKITGESLSIVATDSFTDEPESVSWSKDGNYIAYGGTSAFRVVRFDGSGLERITNYTTSSRVNGVSFSNHHSRLLAVGLNDAPYVLLFKHTEGNVAEFAEYNAGTQVRDVNFLPGYAELAVSASTEGMHLLDCSGPTMTLKQTVQINEAYDHRTARPTGDGSYIALGYSKSSSPSAYGVALLKRNSMPVWKQIAFV